FPTESVHARRRRPMHPSRPWPRSTAPDRVAFRPRSCCSTPKLQDPFFACATEECRTVHSLRAQDVDIIQLSELFGRESFGRTKNHVSGVVNDHVEATVLGNDLLDGCVTRFLRRNVQFDGTQVDIVVLGELFRLFDLWRITALGLTHAR